MEGTEKPQTVDYTRCETSGKDLADDGVCPQEQSHDVWHAPTKSGGIKNKAYKFKKNE